MFMIAPDRCFTIIGRNALHIRYWLFTFRSKLKSQSFSSHSKMVPLCTNPAQLTKISIFSTNNVFKWSNLTFRNQKLHQKLIKLIILGIKSIWNIDLTLQFTELWPSEIHFSCLKDFNFLLCMFYGSCSFRKNMASLHDYMRLRSIEIKNLCVFYFMRFRDELCATRH